MDRLSEVAEASHAALEAYRALLKTDIKELTPRERAILEVKGNALWAEYRELWELSLNLAWIELNKAA